MPTFDLTPAFLVVSSVLLILVLYAYRAITESRFDSLAIVVNIFCLIQGFSLLGTKLGQQGAAPSPVYPPLTAVLLLLALALVQILLVQGRKSRTNDHIKTLLEKNATNRNDHRVMEFVAVAREIIDEDFFPDSFPENVLNAKKRRREIFSACLPEDLFNRDNLQAKHFCLPPEERKGARIKSMSLGILALIILFWVMLS